MGIDTHQLCLAHLVRELRCVDEEFAPEDDTPHPEPWAAQLAALLTSAIAERPPITGPGGITETYRALVAQGVRGGPPTKESYRRERDAWNLAARLGTHEVSVLGFLSDEGAAIGVPPTNNAAENAVKPHKVRQRRSGCFRSRAGAEEYLVIQSYLRSAVLNGVGAIDALDAALAGKPWVPAG